MKNLFFFLLFISIISNSNGQAMIPKDSIKIEDSLSYALGSLIGANLKAQGFNELHIEDLSNGIIHAIVDMGKMDLAKCNSIVEKYVTDKKAAEFGPNKDKGEKFLAENLKNPQIHVSQSGLQYEVLTQGKGKKPGPADSVTVHYQGKLIDGTEFDSSIKRGEPIQFMTNQVISGWSEALQLMNEGSKFRLFIPYQLAYGENGAGPQIPPYSTLIFEVELIKVGS